jgi:hypothetical protein
MTWVRIDDHFDEHPKLAAVGPVGWGVWLAGIAYCNRNLTDGFIPYSIAEGIGGSWHVLVPAEADDADVRDRIYSIERSSGMHGETMDTQWVIDLLVAYGLWVEEPRGYRVHDYEQYQPTKAQVEADRAAKIAAGRAGGIAAATARGRAGTKATAVAQSKPVPVPNPVPRSLTTFESAPRASVEGDTIHDVVHRLTSVFLASSSKNGDRVERWVEKLGRERVERELRETAGDLGGLPETNQLLNSTEDRLFPSIAAPSPKEAAARAEAERERARLARSFEKTRRMEAEYAEAMAGEIGAKP